MVSMGAPHPSGQWGGSSVNLFTRPAVGKVLLMVWISLFVCGQASLSPGDRYRPRCSLPESGHSSHRRVSVVFGFVGSRVTADSWVRVLAILGDQGDGGRPGGKKRHWVVSSVISGVGSSSVALLAR